MGKIKKIHNLSLQYNHQNRCTKSKCDMTKMSHKGFVYLISFTIFFHLGRVLDIFPKEFLFEIPRINNLNDFYGTIISVILNCLILLIASDKAQLIDINLKISQKVTNVILWVSFVMFLLTATGYMFGKTIFERYILVATSFFLAYFVMLIALNNENEPYKKEVVSN